MKFFHTLREKEFVLKHLRRGNVIPLLQYTLYRLRLSHFFSTQRKHYVMPIWYAPLAFWLWTRKDKEKNDELFYEQFLGLGDTVIDCGAHLGTLAMTAAHLVGPKGKIFACEMHPRTFSYLVSNIQRNAYDTIVPYHTAIGNKEGMVSITDEYVSDINHISDIGPIYVPMTTIDTLARNITSLTLLKLDVEGYELQALQGAQSTLARTKAVYFEAAPRNFARYGYTLKDIIVFLEHRGFTCFAFDTHNVRFAITRDYIPSVKYENILAIRM